MQPENAMQPNGAATARRQNGRTEQTALARKQMSASRRRSILLLTAFSAFIPLTGKPTFRLPKHN